MKKPSLILSLLKRLSVVFIGVGTPLSLASTASAVSTTIVISQVYGGGGNAGSNWKNDFIELHNISGVPVSISGWSVQYGSATGSTWASTPISGTIAAGAYFLVQEAAGTGGTSALPTPDGTGSINMSGTAGKVALVNNTTLLSGISSTGSGIVDYVGFGTTANAYEGSGAAPAPSNTTSVLRNNSGSTDTDNNATDFSVAGTIVPRNSATTPVIRATTAVSINVETAANGGGNSVAAQNLGVGVSLTVYAVSRDANQVFVSNQAGDWSLGSVTGGVVQSDLVPSADAKSATLTPHATGSAVIHLTSTGLTSVDSGVITATTASTAPSVVASADNTSVIPGQNVVFTATVTAGANPGSTGLTVTGDFSAIGGASTQALSTGAGNIFTGSATVSGSLSGGSKNIILTVTDSQGRSGTATVTLNLRGNITIFHSNDTHARVTPHKWIIPQHTPNPTVTFENVGGAAYMGGKILQLTNGQPDALVLDGGDISEGNPVGDWNGPGNPVGSFGNGTNVAFYQLLDTKLRAVAGRGGRGLDAMVVGNHDIRDISYINNLKNQTNYPVISINICTKGTHTPYFQPYVILNVNGNKIGVVGYTTESSDSPESVVNSAIDVVKCDWSSTDATKIHFSDYVKELRNTQGCNLVILLTHDGHSDLSTSSGTSTPILVDNAVAKLPEVAITGHWHTYADTVWQPTSLNYKTIFTEEGSFMHYVGELRIDGLGHYISNANYVLRNADIAPDADIANFIETRKTQYAAANPPYGIDQVIGYTADDLLLDNYMKWWSSDEYPWSGNNTAGNWICDGIAWKAAALFGPCDLCLESGGGVRSDIPAGPVTYTQIYETYPWADDTIYMVKMTGNEIWNYFKAHGCDVGLSQGWAVTAYDGVPTAIAHNGQPIVLTQVYNVAISNYMYAHDTVPFSDPSPQTSTYLARTALVEYTSQFTQAAPYSAGGSRYSLNTDFSGGYRAVVMMMNDHDSSTTFDDGFIRLLTATPETVGHLGTVQVPNSLVNADGTVNPANRLSEIEMYRSYLGFRSGVLHPGDIIETWGKGSFYQGDPEFVDQEGITADGVEFKIVGHDDSLAKPTFYSSIGAFWDDVHKNHYVKFIGRKTGTSTVADQTGQSLSVMDVTAYTAKTIPGNVGDLVVVTGIPTSENFGLRFRSDSVVLASTLGITAFPPVSTVTSRIDPTITATSNSSLPLTATAVVNANNTWSLTPIADAQVSSGSPTANYGSSTTLYLQSSNSSFGNERDWLKFDLSSLPAGTIIASARLQLFCWKTAGVSLPVEVDGASDDTWTESGLTWNNQPVLGASLATQTLAAGITNTTYSWDVTPFVQGQFSGDKTVSVVAKPVTEGASDATAPSYAFDSKEFGSSGPVLQVTTQSSGASVTVAHVQFFYRFSTDNSAWGAWSAAATSATAPYATSFTFPQGYGYYEFYSQATDSLGGVEAAPAAAQASVHYNSAPAYTTAAIISISGLSQTFDGAHKAATVTSLPAGLAVTITYNGSSSTPTEPGSYATLVTVTQPGFTGSANGTLTIAQGAQTINFNSFSTVVGVGTPIMLPATSTAGLPVTYISNSPTVVTISGNIATPVAPGSAIITATQAGNTEYGPAPTVSQNITVANAAGSDVPTLPEWALIVLISLLTLIGAQRIFADRRRHTK